MGSLPVTLTAKDVMDRNVLMLDAATPVADAVKKMASLNVWSLVVERQGLPVGVVTDRDILRRCISKGLRPELVKLEEIMSSPIITISPDIHLGDIMQKMVEKEIRRLYVVVEGKIIGRITQTMLFDNSMSVMMTLSSMKYQM